MRGDAGRKARNGAGRIGLFAWCTYDWANHGFPVVIATFVFPAYFVRAIASDPVLGTSYWAYAMSASALGVAAVSPILGAIADRAGRRKPWVAAFTLLCIASTVMLWFARPQPSSVAWALIFAGIANFAFETGWVFYSAMLPSLASKDWVGRLSGWGWSLGYAGGLCCLAVALVVLVQPNPPLFGLDAAQAEPVRAVALLVGLWFGVFSLPFFLLTPDVTATGLSAGQAIRQGLTALRNTILRIGEYRQIALFLIARMIFTDGLNTLFAVGGIYAAVTFGMGYTEILMFGIAMNVSAGIGAFSFGWLDDRIGPKRTILIALAALTVIGAVLLVIHSRTLFWVFALQMGLFFGPAQSASRSLMARMAPPEMVTEMFGLFALTGKATAFLGPALFGWATGFFDSQRVGLSTILVFLIVGAVLLLPVRQTEPTTLAESERA